MNAKESIYYLVNLASEIFIDDQRQINEKILSICMKNRLTVDLSKQFANLAAIYTTIYIP